MRRVGIFAGSFDPIHHGHLAVAQSAIEHLELDTLFFMVEEKPWTAKLPVAIVHRTAMVDAGIEGNTKMRQFHSTDERFDIEKTLPKIETAYPDCELYFIFGADVFLQMNTKRWAGLEKLLKHYMVVFERGNYGDVAITDHAKKIGIVVAIIPSTFPHHSSTDVRAQPHNKQIWVPKAVADYIEEHRLYQN